MSHLTTHVFFLYNVNKPDISCVSLFSQHLQSVTSSHILNSTVVECLKKKKKIKFIFIYLTVSETVLTSK